MPQTQTTSQASEDFSIGAIQPEEDFSVGAVSPKRTKSVFDLDESINRHAQRTGLDENLIRAVVDQESGGNPRALSPKGAQGLMQLMPDTAARFGVRNRRDPEQSLRGGTDYLRWLSDRYSGDVDKVLSGYNAGEGAVDKFGGIPPYKETQNYVRNIKSQLEPKEDFSIGQISSDSLSSLTPNSGSSKLTPSHTYYKESPISSSDGVAAIAANTPPPVRLRPRGPLSALILPAGQRNAGPNFKPHFRGTAGLGPRLSRLEQPQPSIEGRSQYDITPDLRQAAANAQGPGIPLEKGLQQLRDQREISDVQNEAETVPFVPRTIVQEANRFAGKAERAIAGLADYANILKPDRKVENGVSRPLSEDEKAAHENLLDRVSNYFKRRANVAESIGNYETTDIKNSLPRTALKAVADAGMDLASLIAIQSQTGLSLPTIFAGEAALNNSDKDPQTIATETAKAYALGKAYEWVPGAVAKKLNITSQLGTRALGAGLFGGAGAIQTAAAGGNKRQVISQAIAQGGLGALGGPHEKAEGETVSPESVEAVPSEATTQHKIDYINQIENEGSITKSQADLLRSKLENQETFGPGAANVGDVPEGSTTKQLTEAIKNSNVSPRERIDYALNIADKFSRGKSAVEAGIDKAKALTQSLWSGYKGATEVSEPQQILGDFQYKLQKSAFETRKFSQELDRTISPVQQEAITNYIQAGGDGAVLQQRADVSTGSTKKGYELAKNLTDDERTVAQNFSSAFDALFEEANKEGVGVNFIENYVPQIWSSKKAQQVMLAEAQRGILDPSFKFSKARIFESYFEGEQAGYTPKTKDIGKLYQIYSNALNKAIASRQYIADLQNAKASDGRPVVAILGSGKTGMREGPLSEETGAYVRPSTKTADTSDYRVIDHPALRGWKYTTSLEGKPVLLEGQMSVHPEYYSKIKNVLTPSKIATGEGAGYSALRGVKKAQSIAKQTMLGFFSPFHQVQEDVHALGHKTLPYINKTRINFDDPQQQRLIKGGLQVASWHDAEAFSEGLAGGNLTARIPVIGTKLLGPYQEWLFKDHIPNLKMDMALHALKRNTQRYKGKMSPERIAELTASQANNAFGELNYTYLARNQTFQDALRMILLAPDFLEARAKFAGSAFKGQGREQLNALLLLAATQYVTARVLNKLSDDDYHLEPENAFRVIHKGKAYGLRSVPSDLLELYEDPRKFLTHRSSPLTAAAIRAYTGKNEFGKPVNVLEQAKLLAESPIPIQLKALQYKKEMNLWDSFFSSMGLRVNKVEKAKLPLKPRTEKKGV